MLGSDNPLLLMLLTQPTGLDRANPLALLALAQALSQAPVGYVGALPIHIDLATLALLATLIAPPSPRAPL